MQKCADLPQKSISVCHRDVSKADGFCEEVLPLAKFPSRTGRNGSAVIGANRASVMYASDVFALLQFLQCDNFDVK